MSIFKETLFILPKWDSFYWEDVKVLEGCKVVNINPPKLDLIKNPKAKEFYVEQQKHKLLEYSVLGDLNEKSVILIEDYTIFKPVELKKLFGCKVGAIIESKPTISLVKFRYDFELRFYLNRQCTLKYPVILPQGQLPKKEDIILLIDDSKNKDSQVTFWQDLKRDFPFYQFIDLSQMKLSRQELMSYFKRSKIVYSATMKPIKHVNLYIDAMGYGCFPLVPNRTSFEAKFRARYKYNDIFTNFELVQKDKYWKKPTKMPILFKKINYWVRGIVEDNYLYMTTCVDDYQKYWPKVYLSHTELLKKIYECINQ